MLLGGFDTELVGVVGVVGVVVAVGVTHVARVVAGVGGPGELDLHHGPAHVGIRDVHRPGRVLLGGGDLEADHVAAGRYGSRLHFWNLAERRVEQTLELGEAGLLPFEVRWLHDPDADEGFVGAALSSTMWRFRRDNGAFTADPVIAVENVELDGWPLPGGVPSVITDLLVSMDDRFLYVSCCGTGDLQQYDVSDPFKPKLTGKVRIGGILSRESHPGARNGALNGGPQMVEISRDGRRVYFTNSLYGAIDPQFYPDGIDGWMVKLDSGQELALDSEFFIPFEGERPHQVRLAGGDGSSDSYCFPNP